VGEERKASDANNPDGTSTMHLEVNATLVNVVNPYKF
jgi:hypothetical protein